MTGFNSKRDAAADKLDNDDLTIAYMRGYHDGNRATQPAQEPAEWSWVCNECGAHEFLSSVSESDLKFLSCGECGCDEFHKENTTPPQRPWVGLTDEEIKKLSDDCVGVRDETEFIRAIEAKLKEKNT